MKDNVTSPTSKNRTKISAAQDSVQRIENKTGLPDNLKSGIEEMSGVDMSSVQVKRNSSEPAKVGALAYAQGNQIHLGPGQEKHLPHEAWHVVQQAQGRVKPTTSVNGKAVNDNEGLEMEADQMGAKAMQMVNASFENLHYYDSSIAHFSVKQFEKPNSKTSGPPSQEGEPDVVEEAAPFQILATQFEGTYDITMFGDEIVIYARQQASDRKLPVIELRMYDGVLPEIANELILKSRQMIEAKLKSKNFIVRISWLRDEAKAPQKDDGKQSEKMSAEFINTVRSFAGHYGNPQEAFDQVCLYISNKIKVAVDVVRESLTTNLIARIRDPMGALLTGEIMLPVPEAYDMYESSDADLWGEISENPSYHIKAVAFLVLSGRAKQLKIGGGEMIKAGAKERRMRDRSNSLVMPKEVALANLVMGDEDSSARLFLNVVNNAFAKGATVVHAIVEDKGMGKDSDPDGKMDRIDRHVNLLRENGFIVDGYGKTAKGKSGNKIKRQVPSEQFPAAEQSGARLTEPLQNGKYIRDRWRLTITKVIAQGAAAAAASGSDQQVKK